MSSIDQFIGFQGYSLRGVLEVPALIPDRRAIARSPAANVFDRIEIGGRRPRAQDVLQRGSQKQLVCFLLLESNVLLDERGDSDAVLARGHQNNRTFELDFRDFKFIETPGTCKGLRIFEARLARPPAEDEARLPCPIHESQDERAETTSIARAKLMWPTSPRARWRNWSSA